MRVEIMNEKNEQDPYYKMLFMAVRLILED